MNTELQFKKKTIIIAVIVIIVAFLAFGGVCISVGYSHGAEDAIEEYEAMALAEEQVEEKEIVYLPEPEEPDPLVYHVATEKDPLNLREEPLQDSESLGRIPRGTNIDVYEINDHWGFTEYNGTEGWVNLEYCKEGVADPDDFAESEDMVWIVTTDGSYAYHKEYCQYVQRDDIRCVTETEAQAMGRTPCKKCGG